MLRVLKSLFVSDEPFQPRNNIMDRAAVINKNLYQIIRKEMCSLTSKKK